MLFLSYSCYTFSILVMTYSRIALDFVNPVVLGGKIAVFIYGTLWLKIFTNCVLFLILIYTLENFYKFVLYNLY